MDSYQPSYLKSPRFRIHLEYDPKFDAEAVAFVDFLKRASKRRGVDLRYTRAKCEGLHIVLIVQKDQGGNFDAFLQEMIMSSGLFYYSMTIKKQHNKIIHHVIDPIYRTLLKDRFINANWKHIAGHIHGVLSPGEFIPTDTNNEFSKAYELLYRKWILKMTDNSEFIRELDALATKFLLSEIGHEPGKKSPQFNISLKLANQKGVGMDRDFRKALEKVHHWRTTSLHRLNDLEQEDVATTASQLFIYFQYYDEFSASQEETKERLNGKWYARLKYGEEIWLDSKGQPMVSKDGVVYNAAAMAKRHPCNDCGAVKGQYHCEGCDAENCPRCHGQLLSCDCRTDDDFTYYESLEENEI